MNVPAEVSNVENIEKFQSLQAGQYWKAKDDSTPGIEAGHVLLLQKIDWVDNKPHTIIMRAHPSIYDKYIKVMVNGKEKSEKFTEFRFLLATFLDKFEFEENHQPIRTEEMNKIHAEMGEIQAELIQAQSDPRILNKIVEDKLSASTEGKNLPALNFQEARNFISGGIVNAIGTQITATDIENVKAVVSREQQIAEIRAEWINSKTKKLASTLEKLTPFFNEQVACSLAQTNDVREYAEKLLKGIESLDLYIGKGVHIKRISEGKSADESIPLSIMQKKLMVDEEVAVWSDTDEYFDFKSIDKFFEALRNHKELVEQIFPSERCILVMATSRRFIDYGERYTNMVNNNANAEVFLMVRDGENMYQVFSPIESHLGSARLFPSKSDQESIFRGTDGSSIKFEDLTYTRALNRHEEHALHYKRFLILLCGLDHRENLFGKFYEGPKDLKFVSMGFQEKHMNFIHDDDGSDMLPNPDVRMGLFEWARELNKDMRPGSRILASWNSLANKNNCPVLFSRRWRDNSMDYRVSNELSVETVLRRGNELIVSLDAENNYSRGRGNFKATMKISADDMVDGKITGLCVDNIDPADLHYYIHNRGARENQVYYIQFFKKALEYITDERKRESVTREYLLEALNTGNIGPENMRSTLVDKAVLAWKYENPGKELPVVFKCPERQVKQLLNHLDNVAGTKKIDVEKIIDYAKSIGHDPVRVAINGKAQILVYGRAKPEQIDHIIEESPFVNKLTLIEGKSGFSIKSATMDILQEHDPSEKVLFDCDDVKELIKPSVFANHAAKLKVIKKIEDGIKSIKRFGNGLTELEFNAEFGQWLLERDKLCDGYVRNPDYYAAIGCQYGGGLHSNKVYIIYLQADYAALLYHSAPNEDCQKRLRSKFVGRYQDKEAGEKFFEEAIGNGFVWQAVFIQQFGLSGTTGMDWQGRKHNHEVTHRQLLERTLMVDFDQALKSRSKYRTYISPELKTETGCLLDELMDVQIPANYKLMTLKTITNRKEGKVIVVEHGHGGEIAFAFIQDRFGYTSAAISSEIFTSEEEIDKELIKLGLDPKAGTPLEEYDFVVKHFIMMN